MSWKDGLLQGSFRGVEFFIDTHSLSGGRRTISHEFVDRDTPYAEDVGRKARQFSIDIHLVGDDYFTQRDALVSACEQRGSGELIHPYLGLRQVNVVGYSISEDTMEGRVARFSITFVESGTNIYPSIEEDRVSTLLDFAEASKESAKAQFENNFSVINQPGFIVDSALNLVAEAQQAFDDATSVFAETSASATDLQLKLRQLESNSLSLVNDVTSLADNLIETFNIISGVATNADDAARAYETMFVFGDNTETLEFETEQRETEVRNKISFNNFMRQIAIISATEEAVDRDFFSANDAIAEQEKLKNLIQEQAAQAQDINFFQNLNDLTASLVKSVPDIDSELPNLVNLTLQDTTNSVVLAYDLFEDPDREQEIIDRNKIRNPSFVIGGTQLEVLNA